MFKTVYCIALRGKVIGSDWYDTESERNKAMATVTGLPFEMEVPDSANDDEITELVADCEMERFPLN